MPNAAESRKPHSVATVVGQASASSFGHSCQSVTTTSIGAGTWPIPPPGDPPGQPAARVAELRRAASDAGIAITGLHYLMRAPTGLSITSADAAQRTRTVAVMRALCGLCAGLDGTILVHGSPEERVLDPGDEGDGRKRGIECFAAVADAAADAHVTYCIEPLA